MRKAQLGDARQQSVGSGQQIRFIPAPIKGLNLLYNEYKNDPAYASNLVNVHPTLQGLAVRPDGQIWNTLPTSPSVFAKYSDGTIEQLYVTTSAGIYNISTGVPVFQTALTSSAWYSVNFTNSAGTVYLWGANATDAALMYDGAVWSAPAITGISSTLLTSPWVFKRRIFAIEAGTMNAWYLPVDSVQGGMKKFPVGPNFPKGGYLLAGFTWTLDGGNGPDDYCGFISSEGEVAVYEGIDPSSADSFALVGVYRLGKISNSADPRIVVNSGADVLIATDLGLFSLTAVSKGQVATPQTALSAKIAPGWADGVILNITIDETRSLVICCFATGSARKQYVFNLVTRGWGMWTLGINAAITYRAPSSTNLQLFFVRVLSTSVFVLNVYNTDVEVSIAQAGIPLAAASGAPTLLRPRFSDPPSTASGILLTAFTENGGDLLASNGTGLVDRWFTVSTNPGRSFSWGVTYLGHSTTEEVIFYGLDLLFRQGSNPLP